MNLCTLRYALLALFLFLLGYIVHASLQIGLLEQGGQLMDYVWFRVTLADLYIGLLLAGAWAFHRERSPLVATCWTLSFLFLGNLAVACYVWLKLLAVRSTSDLPAFFQGHRSRRPESVG